MIDFIFDNIYFKIGTCALLSLAITFSDKIDMFKDGAIAYILLGLTILLLATEQDRTFVLLLAALYLLTLNRSLNKEIV